MTRSQDDVTLRVRLVFGDVAERVLHIEQDRLGIRAGIPPTAEQTEELAKQLRDLARKVAGDELADRVYAAVKGGPSSAAAKRGRV